MIPFIILSAKDDVLLPIEEAEYKFVFGAAEDFQNMLKNKDSQLHNCDTFTFALRPIK